MNERQEIAYRNPVRNGPEVFSRIYHQDIEREGLMMSTTLTVSHITSYPEVTPSWTASAAVLGPSMQPLPASDTPQHQRRIVWEVLDALLDGVGEGETQRVQLPATFLASRKLTVKEMKEIDPNVMKPRTIWEAMQGSR